MVAILKGGWGASKQTLTPWLIPISAGLLFGDPVMGLYQSQFPKNGLFPFSQRHGSFSATANLRAN